ncbi:MAG: hypothetical protein ACOYNL_10115 [Rickettsiales bacterium]
MTKELVETGLRGQFDAASRAHFSLFLRRVIGSVAPGVGTFVPAGNCGRANSGDGG